MQGDDEKLDFTLLQIEIREKERAWYNAVRANLQSLRFNEEITNIRFELHPTGFAAQEVHLLHAPPHSTCARNSNSKKN